MNRKMKWAAVVGVVALAAVLLIPQSKPNARADGNAVVPVPASTAALTIAPQYGDFVVPATDPTTTPQYNGNYPPQNFYRYMYGMMGYMMGGYWGGQGQSGSGQGNYPYYGMMGGFGYNQGQNGTQYPPPYYYNNGGVSGNVYGQ
ncbi:MAG: hypothetical protein M0Z41_03550 [Peptococcaceae bacterium]|jgi:hypothetical protein|nr:hypothetical protein [Peptococcaceae bacterium]